MKKNSNNQDAMYSTKKCKNELPFTDYPVTLIDARLNKSIDFEEIVSALRAERSDCQFVVKKKAAMETPGETERFLVIRDYGKAAFEEGGPLKDEYGDKEPYRDEEKLKAKGVVLKTLTINLPSGTDLKRDLTVSLSGLHIRDILMRNENISERFPCYSLMEGMVFLYRQKALFVDNGNLYITNLSDNYFFYRKFRLITKRCYKKVEEQIESYYDKPLDKKPKDELKGHQYIIVSKEFVIEITKGILFDHENMQYMVEQKNAFKDEQTRSNCGIIEIDGVFNPDKFFPLLDVTFVRYNQPTVLPFPFKLIEKFIELEEIGYHS